MKEPRCARCGDKRYLLNSVGKKIPCFCAPPEHANCRCAVTFEDAAHELGGHSRQLEAAFNTKTSAEKR